MASPVDPPHGPRLLPRQLGQGGDGGDPRAAAWRSTASSAANDEMATGAIDVLRKHGLRVPAGHPRDRLRRSRPGAPGEPAADDRRAAVRSGRGLGGARDGGADRGAAGAGVHPGRRPARPPSIVRLRPRSAPARRRRAAASCHRRRLASDRARDAGARPGGAAAHRLFGAAPPRRRTCSTGCARRLRGSRESFHAALASLLAAAGTDNERQRMLQSAILLHPRRAARLVGPAGRTPAVRWAEPGRDIEHDEPAPAPAADRRELPAPARPGRTGLDRVRPGVAAGRAGQGLAERRRPHRLSGLHRRRRARGVAHRDVPA